jgi:two-component system sensor histidine kinase RegB
MLGAGHPVSGVERASDESRASARITLRNLIAARTALIALVLLAGIIAWAAGDRLPSGLLPSSDRPGLLIAVLVGWALLNVPSMVALARDRASEGLAGAHLLIDAVALTSLLALSGGSANPFTILYFLPITLATQVSPRWTWALAAACLACFASLFVLVPIAEPTPPPAEPVQVAKPDPHAHHHHEHHHHEMPAAAPEAAPASGDHSEHFAGHQRGMWVAFCIAGVLMTVFVHRTALALARQRAEVARLRQVALEDRHLAAVGTLAAGAAHELGTPLGTIKLLVDELPHMSDEERSTALGTVREQLGRCKLIVSRMASPDLRVSALGVGESWELGELVDELDGLALDVPLRVDVSESVAALTCRQPFEVIAQLLRELIANAAEACRRTGDPQRGITVQVVGHASEVEIVIADRGIGMDEATAASAFDPFYSTRAEGQGMGLGLYLARAHLRQLGGGISLRSTTGEGTRVQLHFPLEASTT